MIDPARLSAFAAMTALVSVVPGPNMLFVMAQSTWRGGRSGARALAGMQLGNALWFFAAAAGLGALLAASGIVYLALTLGGALYLGWLGATALWSARSGGHASGEPVRRASGHPFRDGMAVAMSNPKSLIYVAALLPPFVDAAAPVAPQLAILAIVGIGIDLAIGAAYILAGSRLAVAIAHPSARRAIEAASGAAFLAIAAWVLLETFA